jgi:hypothetical protein
MTRAFSLTSESLSYFVGFALLHSDQTVIVSPWLSDVRLQLPVNNRFSGRDVRLLEALEELDEKDVELFVRTGEQHNEYVKDRIPDHVTLHEIDDLHAKAVVCDEFVYMGSANITQGGLTLNRELCEIVENDYKSARVYLRENLGLELGSLE